MVLSRSRALSVCLMAAIWICSASPGTAQDAAAVKLKTLNIGINRARILLNDTGEFLLCASTDLDTKLAVVDLAKLKVIATREIPQLGGLPVAVGRQTAFLATHGEGIMQLKLSDLQTVGQSAREVPVVQDLYAIGDQLLCSSDGRLRLDLPEMTRTQRKWPLPAHLELYGPNLHIQRDPLGWRIDDQVYDRDMKLLALIPLRGLGNQDWRINSLPRHSDLQLGAGLREENSYYHPELGCTIYAMVPQTLPEIEIPFTLKLVAANRVVVAEAPLGSMSSSLAQPAGNSFQWKFSLPRGSREYVSGPNHGVVPINMIGNRILATLENTLYVWDLEPDVLAGLVQPMLIVQSEPQMVVDFKQPTVIKHTTRGSVGTVKFNRSERYPFRPQTQVTPEGEATVEPAQLVTTENLQQYLEGSKLFQRSDVTAFAEQHFGELMRRAIGRGPQGLPMQVIVTIAAVDQSQPHPQTSEMAYSVLTEVPEDFYGPLLKYQKPEDVPELASRKEEMVGFGEQATKKGMEEAANAKAAAEYQAKQKEERDIAARSYVEGQARAVAQQQELQERIANVRRQDKRRPLTFAIGLLVSVSLVGAAGWLSFLRPPVVGTTSLRGPLLAACGLLPMLTLIGLTLIETSYGNIPNEAIDHQRRNMTYFMLTLSILLALGMLWLGTVITVVDKKGNVILGILLGLISPLGLAIAVLLPGEPFILERDDTWETDKDELEGEPLPKRKARLPKPPNRRRPAKD